MTTRNLEALFEPASIALIGASNQPGSIGAVLARNMTGAGFAGPVWLVNPHEDLIKGQRVYRTLADLPSAPDLAIIATPAATIPAIVSELGARGCRAAVVISTGFSDPALHQALLDAARPTLLRIAGPNCLGFLSPARGINASFAHLTPAPGRLALVAQSGAVTTAALDWAAGRGLGFSQVVTLGDMADIDFGDVLDYLASDPATHAIMLYVESIRDARKFMSAARIAARAKPVVAVKAGRSAAGARAAWSHTGALAGSDLVYDAAFRRAGIVRVDSLREMFDAVVTLTSGVSVAGDRLTLLTNGGGAGVMAADALEARAGALAVLSPETLAALDPVLPKAWSHGNPVDIIGDAPPERYGAALKVLLHETASDAVLVLNCPTALADGAAAAQVIINTAAAGPKRPILSCWLGDPAARPSRALFAAAMIPTYETPEEAVDAFSHLAGRHRNLELLAEVPAGALAEPDRAAASALLDRVRAEERSDLTEPEAKALLAAYAIPVLESRTVKSPVEAAALAGEWQGPFALKILSPDITHKSDVGGVALNLGSGEAVELAAREMLERIAAKAPAARIEGFVLQQMANRPHGRELIVGLSADPTFGPVLLFGQGGVEVEVVSDRVMGLPPLNRPLALDMIGRTRVARRLGAFRDRPAADVGAVADVLARLGQLAMDFPQVSELDINPLIADVAGVLAMDARVRLAGAQAPRAAAIRPYPQDLATSVTLAGGEILMVRAIRPQDAADLVELIARSSHEDVRFRFRGSLRELPRAWADRLAQIDYEREMALVGFEGANLSGVARLVCDPLGESGEFALMVRTDRQNHGVGEALLHRLRAYAKSRGLARVWGEVDRTNEPMLGLADRLGFSRTKAGDPTLTRVEFSL